MHLMVLLATMDLTVSLVPMMIYYLAPCSHWTQDPMIYPGPNPHDLTGSDDLFGPDLMFYLDSMVSLDPMVSLDLIVSLDPMVPLDPMISL